MRHRLTIGLVSGVLAASALAAAAPAARAQDSAAPATTASADGRSVTTSGGAMSLSVSQVTGLDPDGQAVSVRGQGFPTDKGIYVAFCVVPPTNLPPSPCGGGRGDQSGAEGASLWISSNPPVYAQGVPTPYGAGGTFEGTVHLSAALAAGVDCRQVRCAVVTRADHTRGSDRSLDLFVPVSFDPAPPGGGGPGTPTTAPPPAPTVPTTTAALDPSQVAPVAAVAADGRSVTAGALRLQADQVSGLDPRGAKVRVEGSGFDAGRGIYVALCAVPDHDPSLPAGASTAPGPCTAGGEGAAAWISSNPPEYGRDLARPYGPGGSFAVDLELRAVIDDQHDCREVGCALVTRNDDAHAADRTQDLYLPVAFERDGSSATTAAGAVGSARAASAGGGGGGAGPLAAGIAAVAVVGGVVGALALRSRRREAAR
jgi:hypothetical protein